MNANAAALAPNKSTTLKHAAGRLLALVWGGPEPSVRARVAAAFRRNGIAVAERSAHERTRDWYRSSRGTWTRGLS